MHSFNYLHVVNLIDSHRAGDADAAYKAALEAIDSEDLVISCIYPDSQYNEEQIIDLLEAKLQALNAATVDLAHGLYIPEIVGLVLKYLDYGNGIEEVIEHGETSSKPVDGSQGEDPTGT